MGGRHPGAFPASLFPRPPLSLFANFSWHGSCCRCLFIPPSPFLTRPFCRWQVILCNPICVLLFGWISTQFFKRRVQFEEMRLRSFFPDYSDYSQSTPILIPGVKGVDQLLAMPPRPAMRRHQSAAANLQHT